MKWYEKTLEIPNHFKKDEVFHITWRGFTRSYLLTGILLSSFTRFIYPPKEKLVHRYPSEQGQYQLYKQRIEERYLWIKKAL